MFCGPPEIAPDFAASCQIRRGDIRVIQPAAINQYQRIRTRGITKAAHINAGTATIAVQVVDLHTALAAQHFVDVARTGVSQALVFFAD